MSGGPLLRRNADGTESVVGFVSSYAEALDNPGTRTALGGVVLCGRIADLRQVFPVVDENLARARTSPSAATASPSAATAGEELSADATASLRAALGATAALPTRWTADAIETVIGQLSQAQSSASRALDELRIAAEAVRAKPAFMAVEGREVELRRLYTIYRREIGAWPTGRSADALLVEAADADLHERRSGVQVPLLPLTRFLVAVACERRLPVADSSVLMEWLAVRGCQLGDARRFEESQAEGGWLLVDLGDEPGPTDPPYPMRVGWTLYTGDSVMGQAVATDGTREGLKRALCQVFREIPPTHPLIVDLAVPCALLTESIESWPVREVDGVLEPLSAECQPRLRWSRRQRCATLHGRLRERTNRASWDLVPQLLATELLEDETRLTNWAKAGDNSAWLLGGLPAASSESPLRRLLRAGYGFVVWLPGADREDHPKAIREAAAQLPSVARRDQLPDHLPAGAEPSIVIWDDPRGRAQFTLPPLLSVESP
jgi:hypothetical protein